MANIPQQRGIGSGGEPASDPQNDQQNDPQDSLEAQEAAAGGRAALLTAVEPIMRLIVRSVRDRGLANLASMVKAVEQKSGGGIVVLFPTAGRNRFEVEYFSEGFTGRVLRRLDS